MIDDRLNLPTLMNNLPGMVYRCRNDEDWTMEFVSAGCYELTGFNAEQLENNAFISYGGLIHPEDRYMVWVEVNKGIEQKSPFKIVYRLIVKGGKEKWVYEQGQGIFDQAEELSAIEGFITDISDQKNAELRLEKSLYEKKLLLSEIHHRVKNNMQFIISMLSVQKENNPECKPVIDTIINRLRIFSDMHQQLYSDYNEDNIAISKQIKTIFDNQIQSYGYASNEIEIEVDSPDLRLGLDKAIPLGLIVNELISNSLKHAFESKHGRIRITIRSSGQDNIEYIEYADSGRDLGAPDEGFGLLLVELLSGQLGFVFEVVPEGRVKFIFRKKTV